MIFKSRLLQMHQNVSASGRGLIHSHMKTHFSAYVASSSVFLKTIYVGGKKMLIASNFFIPQCFYLYSILILRGFCRQPQSLLKDHLCEIILADIHLNHVNFVNPFPQIRRFLTPLQQTTFEIIVAKGEIAHN